MENTNHTLFCFEQGSPTTQVKILPAPPRQGEQPIQPKGPPPLVQQGYSGKFVLVPDGSGPPDGSYITIHDDAPPETEKVPSYSYGSHQQQHVQPQNNSQPQHNSQLQHNSQPQQYTTQHIQRTPVHVTGTESSVPVNKNNFQTPPAQTQQPSQTPSPVRALSRNSGGKIAFILTIPCLFFFFLTNNILNNTA